MSGFSMSFAMGSHGTPFEQALQVYRPHNFEWTTVESMRGLCVVFVADVGVG
jgi:hypothetical protein